MKQWMGIFLVVVLCVGGVQSAKIEGCDAAFLAREVAGYCSASQPSAVCCKVLASVFRRRYGVTCAQLIAQQPALKDIYMGEHMIVNMFLKCAAVSTKADHDFTQIKPGSHPASHPAEETCPPCHLPAACPEPAPCPQLQARRCPKRPIPTPPPPRECPPQCPLCPPPPPPPVEDSWVVALTKKFHEFAGLGMALWGVLIVIKLNINELLKWGSKARPSKLPLPPKFMIPTCEHCGSQPIPEAIIAEQLGSNRYLLEGADSSDAN